MAGSAVWRLRRLPRAGGLEDQDAKLMDALDWCRQVANALLAKGRTPQTERDELRAFHDEQVRAKGHNTVH